MQVTLYLSDKEREAIQLALDELKILIAKKCINEKNMPVYEESALLITSLLKRAKVYPYTVNKDGSIPAKIFAGGGTPEDSSFVVNDEGIFMKKPEYKIGEVFTYKNTKLMCIQGMDCRGCHFHNDIDGCHSHVCSANVRDDGNYVLFEKVY